MNYNEFLESKKRKVQSIGKQITVNDIHPMLFDFQKDTVKWAVKMGRCAVFLDTGLGKTFCQLEWSRFMGKTVLIFAPLSVSRQTIREGKKINVEVRYIRDKSELSIGISITNYENIDKFEGAEIDAIVLDESSILKSIDGNTRRKLIKYFKDIPYKLCCTATPAPNDYTELGNHAEFLGVCSTAEMLSTYFVNANKESEIMINGNIVRRKHSNKQGTQWRMRHHAQKDYFAWLSSWAMALRRPSDLGYNDNGFILPKLNITPVIVNSNYSPKDELFFTGLKGLQQRADVRSSSTVDKINKIKEIVNSKLNEQWLIWCGLDKESKLAKQNIECSIEVKGSDDAEFKANSFEDFQDGKIDVLITKSKIGGYGMNFQNCHNIIFFGLNDSWESFYQCIRRCYRFGQKSEVNVYVVISDIEIQIFENIQRKGEMAERMMDGLINQVKDCEMEQFGKEIKIDVDYLEKTTKGEKFIAMLGDSCERLKEVETDSIDLSVYSPPFADLYTYSASERDLGNSRGKDDFIEHYGFIIGELLRVTKQGRLSCVHTSDIPAMQMKDGYIGIKDFPGAVIKAHEDNGWIFHGRAIVTKNPQAQAIRTKSKALLFTQLRKDSSDSRPALLDHILIFKKPGKSDVPVNPVANGEIDNEKWIDWAGGIWTGINESDTLQYTTARDKDDEKHICPLQLGTIERCLKLYSNPGELILSPFMGIGSEIYEAIKFGRKGIGIELKQSYFRIALNNLQNIENETSELNLGFNHG